jgi:hypothetical protein
MRIEIQFKLSKGVKMQVKYARFKSEEDLLKSVLQSLPFDVYPRVSAIAGKKINPDIDILQINRVSDYHRLIGYELKLMKFDKRSKGLSWEAFYKGIGQALLYLKNGVHRVFLILGFHENIPNDKMIENFCNWLWDKKELISQVLGNHISIGMCLYEGGSIYEIIEAKLDFHPSDDETKFLTEALLKGRFTFDKKIKRPY